MASRQETSVHNSNPSPNPSGPFPSFLHDLLERALLGVRQASAGSAPTVPDNCADTPRGGEHAGTHDTDTAKATDDVGRLELAELLGVLREPIEWVFTLAERHAHDDPVDIAAIHRVRDAVRNRVNAIMVGAPSVGTLRIRPADLLTVTSLLVAAVDPNLVQRAVRGVGNSIADALIVMLQFDPSLVADLEGEPGTVAEQPHAPRSVASSWYIGPIPTCAAARSWYAPPTPPMAMRCSGPFMGPPISRPITPPWFRPHFRFAF
jgi:hypothetical protein